MPLPDLKHRSYDPNRPIHVPMGSPKSNLTVSPSKKRKLIDKSKRLPKKGTLGFIVYEMFRKHEELSYQDLFELIPEVSNQKLSTVVNNLVQSRALIWRGNKLVAMS